LATQVLIQRRPAAVFRAFSRRMASAREGKASAWIRRQGPGRHRRGTLPPPAKTNIPPRKWLRTFHPARTTLGNRTRPPDHHAHAGAFFLILRNSGVLFLLISFFSRRHHD
jgi:hypothetical protein